jgi:hypothetical protein
MKLQEDKFVVPRVQGPLTALELHTLGWKAFQDLCAQVSEEVLKRTVSIYREAQDGGQDAVFLTASANGEETGVGTLQCKFSAASNRRLRLSDLLEEEDTVRELVAKGEATSYVLMTSMGVDAPVAAAIRSRLFSLGVSRPHVLGREFITWAIRRSARLRALVPRVYGLGDLSTILDERRAEQTKRLLGHLVDTLRVYVPTEAHRNAIRALSEHGIVLLLGEPATGKSTIAAILATTMSEVDHHEGFKCEGPFDLAERWNPLETNRFYWVDDAFGATQLRSDYVDSWISIMQKVQAAVASGNRFVLTSRRHIYEAAKPKLGTRNHPAFKNQRAIVDVGELSEDERQQILYNHIKAGNQSRSWKQAVTSYLDDIATESRFVPEIARRLADPVYTVKLGVSRASLLSFVRAPKPHLIEVIEELARVHQAALALVYIHRSQLPANAGSDATWDLVATAYGVDKVSLGDALLEIDRSFIVRATDEKRTWWAFKHPTIADALSEILGQRPELTELYLRGAHWRDILVEVVCVDAEPIMDAVVIPAPQTSLLVNRLREIPDEPDANLALYEFLAVRASDECLREVLIQEPTLFARTHHFWYKIVDDPQIRAAARFHRLRLLPSDVVENAVERMRYKLLDQLDASFLEDDELLALFKPRELLEFAFQARKLLPRLSDHAERIEGGATDHYDAEMGFDDYRLTMEAFEKLFADDGAAPELLDLAKYAMEEAIERMRVKFPKPNRTRDSDDLEPDIPMSHRSDRSIFSDVAD